MIQKKSSIEMFYALVIFFKQRARLILFFFFFFLQMIFANGYLLITKTNFLFLMILQPPRSTL